MGCVRTLGLREFFHTSDPGELCQNKSLKAICQYGSVVLPCHNAFPPQSGAAAAAEAKNDADKRSASERRRRRRGGVGTSEKADSAEKDLAGALNARPTTAPADRSREYATRQREDRPPKLTAV